MSQASVSEPSFTERGIELLTLVADIDYGHIQLTPKYDTVEFYCFYTSGDEERVANDLISRLLGADFAVTRSKNIGHTTFAGTWNELRVEICTGPGAFCEKVQVGERVEPAQEALPSRVVPVYEWRCADPILEAAAS